MRRRCLRATVDETVIPETPLRQKGDAVRHVALGLAIVVTIGCGTSHLESWGVFSNLIAKGRTALQDADEKIRQNRPDAAYYILRRHVNDVNDAIAKVRTDPEISERDKPKVVEALREYQRDFTRGADSLRAVMNMQSDLSRR